MGCTKRNALCQIDNLILFRRAFAQKAEALSLCLNRLPYRLRGTTDE
jgi:hypothetical protein